jgi:DNA polymerase bacteriophage-type
VVQALARLVLTEAMIEIAPEYKIALTVHDEICLVVPDAKAEAALVFAKEVMCRPPTWAPGLPLEVEGFVSQRSLEPWRP